MKFHLKLEVDLNNELIPKSCQIILKKCFSYTPEERPTAKNLLVHFKQLVKVTH